MKTAKYTRLALLAGLSFSLLPIVSGLGSRAYAAGEGIVWFWEDHRTYGWSSTIDDRHASPPPKHYDHKLSLVEQCGRLVGRLLLRDRPGRTYSVQLEDTCVRNGGKL